MSQLTFNRAIHALTHAPAQGGGFDFGRGPPARAEACNVRVTFLASAWKWEFKMCDGRI